MTDDDLHTVFQNYLDAFAAPSVSDQERLLRSSLAEDVVFTNPGVEGKRIHNLLSHIGAFQERFPRTSFRMNWLRQQHGQRLLEWRQVDENGFDLVTGHTYAQLDERDHIVHLAGFWSPGAV